MSEKGTPYSSDKMLWWAVREAFPPKVPKQVQVILSDLCQMDCVNPDGEPWCAYRMPGNLSNELFVGDSEVSRFGHNNPKRFMPSERVLSLLDEMKAAGVMGIQYTGGGEPLLHPLHQRIFERSIELKFACSLVSNGLALTRDVKKLLADFKWVRISIDAGNAETYSKTRTTHPDNYQKVLGNISDIAAAISERGSECKLGMGFVVMPHNWTEIEAGVVSAKKAGCHNVRFSAMFGPEDERPYAGIYDKIKNAINQAKHHETELFKVYDLFGDRIDDLVLGNPDYDICSKMHYCSYIGADMQAYVCCVYSYNERGKIAGEMGNLLHRRFDDFWASEERKKFMEEFDPKLCKRCQFNPANRIMNEVVGKDCMHKEFP